MKVLFTIEPRCAIFSLESKFHILMEEWQGQDSYILVLYNDTNESHQICDPTTYARAFRMLRLIFADLGKNVPVDITDVKRRAQEEEGLAVGGSR